jgi:hypothetical protein
MYKHVGKYQGHTDRRESDFVQEAITKRGEGFELIFFHD